MPMETTHVSLLARLGNGADVAAWRDFERRYGPLVVGYCLRRGLQISDAEDVRQTVMTSLAKAMRTFVYSPEKGRFRDYFGRTVRNAVSRHLAQRRGGERPVSIEGVGEPSAGGDDSDAEWERQWVRHHCRLAMDALRASEPPRNVEVFELLMQGKEAGAVGAAFGLSAEAVRKIKQRVRERLSQLLQDQLREEEDFGRKPL